MKTALTTLACAGLIAGATVASAPAEARYRGGDVAAGAVLGLAAGTLIGTAIAAPPYSYAPSYAPPPRRVYYYEPIAEPACYLAQRRVWVEGFGWTLRRVEVCE